MKAPSLNDGARFHAKTWLKRGRASSSVVVRISFRGKGKSPSWIQICQSSPSCRKAYCSQVVPSTEPGPISIAPVIAWGSGGLR